MPGGETDFRPLDGRRGAESQMHAQVNERHQTHEDHRIAPGRGTQERLGYPEQAGRMAHRSSCLDSKRLNRASKWKKLGTWRGDFSMVISTQPPYRWASVRVNELA